MCVISGIKIIHDRELIFDLILPDAIWESLGEFNSEQEGQSQRT